MEGVGGVSESALSASSALNRIDDATTPDEIRPELVTKVLEALLADADRCEGVLQRADIDRTYVKRDLHIVECAWVESKLRAEGVAVNDFDSDDTEDDGKEDDGSASFSVLRVARRARFLSEAEERDCGRKIQLASRLTENDKARDPIYSANLIDEAQRATDRLVTTNLRYVMKVAREFGPRQHLTLEDLYQEGVLGVIRATELYDPNQGFRFKTYATWWIRQRIYRAIANLERTIRLPVHLQETIRKISRARKRFQWETGRPASVTELARSLGVSSEYMAKLLWRIQATHCVEADSPIGDDDLTHMDLQPDRESPSAFDEVADEQLQDALTQVLSTLTPREERIIRLRFGLQTGQERTLEEIGQDFGVTRERIRQIEAKALRKLQHPTRLRRVAAFR